MGKVCLDVVPLRERANFSHWCIIHIQQYGFDGIDIDWEFPGYIKHKGTDQDRENFTILPQAIRDSLKSLEEKSGRRLLLTVSLPAASVHLLDIEVEKITSIVDYMNIMTYDLYGCWGKISNHNSALYGPAQGDSARCLDGAFKLYHETHNVPADKITRCAAFFGYSYSNCTEIYGEHQGADTILFKDLHAKHYAMAKEIGAAIQNERIVMFLWKNSSAFRTMCAPLERFDYTP